MDRKVETHPSYGIASVTRVTGNPGCLFGSPLDHHYTSFRIRVSGAIRDLESSDGMDHIRSDRANQYIEIELSANQFTDLITNMNTGDGVPCTIRRLNNKGVEAPPPQNVERNRVREKFDEKVKEVFSKLAAIESEVSEILSKKTFGKSDKSSIQSKISNIRMEVENNMPFILELFNEATERTISSAKTEVDSFVSNALTSIGLDKVKNFFPGGKEKLIPDSTEE